MAVVLGLLAVGVAEAQRQQVKPKARTALPAELVAGLEAHEGVT